MIKTSTHKTNYSNSMKLEKLSNFIDEYHFALQFFIDYLWSNKISYNSKTFSIADNLLDCPQFISTKYLNIKTNLSARALKCAATQACGMVKAAIEKKKRLLFVRDNLISNKKRTRSFTKKN